MLDERGRTPLAAEIERKLMERDAWERADAGRIGGADTRNWRSPDYGHLTDDELIRKYMEDEANRRAYENDRR